MNHEWVLFHLREAREELARTITEIEADSTYGYGEFSVAMQHLYHHVNTAWNAREASPLEVQAASDVDFNRWNRYPTDLLLMEV